MPTQDVLYDQQGDVAVVTIDRPGTRNALTSEVFSGLSAALDRARAEEIKALVLTGGNGYFSSGVDMRVLEDALAGDVDAVLTALLKQGNAIVSALRGSDVPILTAVEGGAVGGGFGLALTADLCVAGRSARLSPQHIKLGVTPDMGTSYFVAKRVGPARARALLLSSPALDGDTAFQLGLVDHVVPDGEALEAAVSLARELATRPATAVTGTRLLSDLAVESSLDDHLDAEASWVARCWRDPSVERYVSSFRSPKN